jgi:hypothetical protein
MGLYSHCVSRMVTGGQGHEDALVQLRCVCFPKDDVASKLGHVTLES